MIYSGWPPPLPVIVSALPASAAPAVVDYLLGAGLRVSGAAGPLPEAEALAEAWTSATGERSSVHMRQRLFRLDRLRPPGGERGMWRLAGETDVGELALWRKEFADETTGGMRDPAGPETAVRQSLTMGDGYTVWQVDRGLAAFAVASNPSYSMSRIGPVYTPQRCQGSGYGTAVTAAVSKWALDAGANHVVLFTDLANPISNSIYQKIGYRPVLDGVEYRFENQQRRSAG